MLTNLALVVPPALDIAPALDTTLDLVVAPALHMMQLVTTLATFLVTWILMLKLPLLSVTRLRCVQFHLLSIIKLTVFCLSFRLGDTLCFLLLDFYS